MLRKVNLKRNLVWLCVFFKEEMIYSKSEWVKLILISLMHSKINILRILHTCFQLCKTIIHCTCLFYLILSMTAKALLKLYPAWFVILWFFLFLFLYICLSFILSSKTFQPYQKGYGNNNDPHMYPNSTPRDRGRIKWWTLNTTP